MENYNDLLKMIIDMNIFLHKNEKSFKYHIQHCYLMEKYMYIIARKLSSKYSNFMFDDYILSIISFAHDLLKDRESRFSNLYQKNKHNYKRFNLSEKMYNAINTHAYRSAEFLSNYPFNITNGKILYPILFHSSPIMEIYNKILSEETRRYIDLTILCDKLSSNQLRISSGQKVAIDLDLEIFGSNYDEFNYERGLYLARLINKIYSKYDIESIEFYNKKYNNNLSIEVNMKEVKLWQKRNNPLLQMQSSISTMLLQDANLRNYIMPIISFSENEKIIHPSL